MTLVELMVGVTLSLLLTGAVLQVYLSVKSTYRVSEGLSRLQEGARFSMQMLARDIRMAGYVPCSRPQRSQNLLTSGRWWAQSLFDSPVRGFEGDSGAATFPGSISKTVAAGSDAIIILRAGSQVAAVNFYDAAGGRVVLQRSQPSGWVENGSVMVICSPTYASLFKAGKVGTRSIALGSAKGFTHAYGNGAQIADYSALLYYIRPSSSAHGNSLYRRYLNINKRGQAGVIGEELIEGIESMQLVYGVDSNHDGVADRYVNAALVNAAGDWANVVAVRVGMLFASQDGLRSHADRQTYIVAGARIGAGDSGPAHPQDRRKRYVSSMTVRIRNR